MSRCSAVLGNPMCTVPVKEETVFKSMYCRNCRNRGVFCRVLPTCSLFRLFLQMRWDAGGAFSPAAGGQCRVFVSSWLSTLFLWQSKYIIPHVCRAPPNIYRITLRRRKVGRTSLLPLNWPNVETRRESWQRSWRRLTWGGNWKTGNLSGSLKRKKNRPRSAGNVESVRRKWTCPCAQLAGKHGKAFDLFCPS